MLRIFLCHVKDDRQAVEALYNKLSVAGFKPWMEERDILPGEKPEVFIPKAIRESHLFLACLSAKTVNARGEFRRQINWALDVWQGKIEDDIYLIPVRLEPCELPDNLAGFYPLDLFQDDGWERLLKASQRTKETLSEVSPSASASSQSQDSRMPDSSRIHSGRDEAGDAQFQEGTGAGRTMEPSPDSGQRTRPQSSQIITWLHLSDLHFRESRAYDENIVLKALLRDVDERVQSDGLQPDFVVITGDTAFSGQWSEYKLADEFFNKLLGAVNLPRERLFIVPGNHDVDRKQIGVGAKAIGADLTDRDKVNELLTSPADRRLVMARFKGYKKFVNDYCPSYLTFSDERYFYAHPLNVAGQQIALLGLNSAWLCASDEDKANGLLLGERQVRAALGEAEEANLKIALLHHPFDWLREFDQNDSAALLLDGCDFILHGHLHRTAMTQLVSPDSGAMAIAGGACYETRQYPNSYNFVRLNLPAGTGTVYLRRYSDQRGGFWAKDTLSYRNVPDGKYTFGLHIPAQVNVQDEPSPPPIRDNTRNAQSVPQRTQSGTLSSETSVVDSETGRGDLRQRLGRFDDVELEALCMDYFPVVYDKFSAGMRRDRKINLLLDHCRRFPEDGQRLRSILEG